MTGVSPHFFVYIETFANKVIWVDIGKISALSTESALLIENCSVCQKNSIMGSCSSTLIIILKIPCHMPSIIFSQVLNKDFPKKCEKKLNIYSVLYRHDIFLIVISAYKPLLKKFKFGDYWSRRWKLKTSL